MLCTCCAHVSYWSDGISCASFHHTRDAGHRPLLHGSQQGALTNSASVLEEMIFWHPQCFGWPAFVGLFHSGHPRFRFISSSALPLVSSLQFGWLHPHVHWSHPHCSWFHQLASFYFALLHSPFWLVASAMLAAWFIPHMFVDILFVTLFIRCLGLHGFVWSRVVAFTLMNKWFDPFLKWSFSRRPTQWLFMWPFATTVLVKIPAIVPVRWVSTVRRPIFCELFRLHPHVLSFYWLAPRLAT